MKGQACLAAVVSFWPLNVAALLLVGSVTRRLSDCSRLSDWQHHRVRQLCKLRSLHGARPMAALLHKLHNNNTPLFSYTTSTFTPSVMQSWKCLSTTMPKCISNLFLLGGGFLQSPKCPRLWSATGTVTSIESLFVQAHVPANVVSLARNGFGWGLATPQFIGKP